ncbi:hypothetical protein G7Y89_g9523 [Cudoniella acicularis]|uniref:Uncharacterized protein n=1 Tax=Cudoniella acicularis TaxID=354080 RepID=A0A8H4RH52_9HELO|nr:hypothetical protein G7Y89_g9523 [Cudoniella acicularis]
MAFFKLSSFLAILGLLTLAVPTPASANYDDFVQPVKAKLAADLPSQQCFWEAKSSLGMLDRGIDALRNIGFPVSEQLKRAMEMDQIGSAYCQIFKEAKISHSSKETLAEEAVS